MVQRDLGFLSESVLQYLRDLPSPVIPACVYPHLQTALMQQHVLQQSAGTSDHRLKILKLLLVLTEHLVFPTGTVCHLLCIFFSFYNNVNSTN